MEAEDFERWLCVGVEGWLVLDLLDTYFLEELIYDTHQVAQSDASIDHHSFALMEFSQMGSIQSFISEHSVDREVFNWLEFFLLGKFVEHLRADSGGVSSEEVLP